ncbi:uncharacterized protein LOC123015887 isoform X3 [Tribolium madens]|nr:uncharacterized protein LOC123015887 isoform X2 [Tribolium madens]XP_044271869.1 uncharacterized protein LOC123015887 isoform X3 [Tribolium madens]
MATNKFKKRPGTTDFGKKYEDLNLARLVLKMVTDDSINDFMISSNDDKFGDFDDIVIELKCGKTEVKKALQIKYSNDSKILPVQSLWSDKGDFSLKKYLKSYKQIEQFSNSHKLILFTNRKLDLTQELCFTIENISVKIVEENVDQLLNTSRSNGKCFKFESLDENPETVSFFKNFILLTNQASVSAIEKITLEEFQNTFYCPSDHFYTYLQFISRWSLLEGNKEKLSKELMKRVIALNVLSPFIKPYSQCLVTDEMILFRQAIANFQITVFRTESYDQVKEIWGDAYKKLEENNEVNRIRNKYQLCHDDCTKLLWLIDETPLMVLESKTTSKIIQMCENKFIVFGNDPILPLNRTIFRNLSDLSPGSEIFNFKCCFQEKEEQSLDTLLDEMKQVLTTDELLEMLHGTYSFGGKKETLPVPYIERSLTKNIIHFDYLHKMDSKILAVINCKKKLEKIRTLLKKFNVVKGLDYLNDFCYGKEQNDFKPKLILFEDECLKDEFDKIKQMNEAETIHHFNITEDGNLEWLKSHKNVTALKHFCVKNGFIDESHIFDNISNSVNLVIGEPGIGKSIFVKNLKNQISPKLWTIILHPAHFRRLDVFNRHTFEEFILNEVNKDSDKKILQVLMKKNRVVYILDALDEIPLQQVTLICDFITKENLSVWITSRPHLQNYLEDKLNVLSRTIMPLSDDQKKSYIGKRLKEKYPERDIETEVAKIQIYINQDILDNPLHMYMLTEVFREDIDKYLKLSKDLFNVSDLYEYWIEQKFVIYYHQKFGVLSSDCVLMEHRNYLQRDYQLAALKLLIFKCENDDFLKKIKLEGDPIGIIIEVTDEMLPIFFHTSIAEFFVASYFAKNFAKVSSDILFKEENKNIRYFFDLLLAHNSIPHMAVFYRNLETLKKFEKLEDFKDLGGRNVLHLACSWGQTYPRFDVEKEGLIYMISKNETTEVLIEDPIYKEMIIYLLEKLDFSHRDTLFNFSPMKYAEAANCLFTKTIILQKLKHKFTNLDASMASLFYYAAENGYEDVFDLYETFPLVEIKNQSSYLHLCVCHENFLKRLLTIQGYQKMINDVGTSGETALHKSCKEGYYESAKLLLQYGANCVTTNDGWTPLHLACLNGHESIVTLLENIDVNIASNKGYTALHVACYKGYTNIVKLLLDLGASFDGHTSVTTPLFLACHYGHEDIARMLLQLGSPLVATNDGWSPLHSACEKGHEQIVKLLIESGAKVTIVDHKNITPLHLASHEGHESIVKLLLELGSNVDAQDNMGLTSLHLASHRNFVEIAKLLIESGASCNVPDDKGSTPLHWACQEGCDKIIELLLASGANLETVTKTGKTPFHLACLKGHEVVVRLLITSVNPRIATSRGFTPLHLACQEGHDNVVELLLQTGVDSVTQEGSSPLHWACHNGHYNIVKMLIKSGVKVDIMDIEGSTALLLACYQGFDDIVKLLIHSGANIATSNHRGFTPLHWASQQNHPNLVKILLELGAKVSTVTKQGVTPLHLACQNGHDLVVKLLLVSGANIEDVTNSGWTPLHWASFRGHETVTNLLLGADANVNVGNNERMTSLHLVCSKGFVEIANTLIEFGANTESVNCGGFTPLHLACQGGHSEVVKLLIMYKVNTSGVSNDGKTPFQIAYGYGYYDISEMLKNRGDEVTGKYSCIML